MAESLVHGLLVSEADKRSSKQKRWHGKQVMDVGVESRMHVECDAKELNLTLLADRDSSKEDWRYSP